MSRFVAVVLCVLAVANAALSDSYAVGSAFDVEYHSAQYTTYTIPFGSFLRTQLPLYPTSRPQANTSATVQYIVGTLETSNSSDNTLVVAIDVKQMKVAGVFNQTSGALAANSTLSAWPHAALSRNDVATFGWNVQHESGYSVELAFLEPALMDSASRNISLDLLATMELPFLITSIFPPGDAALGYFVGLFYSENVINFGVIDATNDTAIDVTYNNITVDQFVQLFDGHHPSVAFVDPVLKGLYFFSTATQTIYLFATNTFGSNFTDVVITNETVSTYVSKYALNLAMYGENKAIFFNPEFDGYYYALSQNASQQTGAILVTLARYPVPGIPRYASLPNQTLSFEAYGDLSCHGFYAAGDASELFLGTSFNKLLRIDLKDTTNGTFPQMSFLGAMTIYGNDSKPLYGGNAGAMTSLLVDSAAGVIYTQTGSVAQLNKVALAYFCVDGEECKTDDSSDDVHHRNYFWIIVGAVVACVVLVFATAVGVLSYRKRHHYHAIPA